MTLNIEMQLIELIGKAFFGFSKDKKLSNVKEKMIDLYIDGYRFILKFGFKEMEAAQAFRYSDKWLAENNMSMDKIPRNIALLYFKDVKMKSIKEEKYEDAIQCREYLKLVENGTDEEYDKLLPILRKIIRPRLDISITKKGFNLTICMVTNYVLFQDQFEKIVLELNP